MNWTAMVGDCRDLPLPNESVEAVVTDPPYGLSFMGREWDHDVPGPEYWTEVKRVMKPGAHLLAFGGTRTWHWLTVGIEEAGFEVRDCLSWMYGTGFPKSHDISKAIDERPGADLHDEFAEELHEKRVEAGYSNSFTLTEEVTGKATGAVANWEKYQWPDPEYWPALKDAIGMSDRWDPVFEGNEREVVAVEADNGKRNVEILGEGEYQVTVPKSEVGQRWDGWGTALKPGWEPIVLAMKPTDGTFAENALEHGVAGLNIDGCRIGVEKEVPASPRRAEQGPAYGDLSNDSADGVGHDPDTGRWPANVTLSHTRWCRKVGTKEVKSGVSGPQSKDSFKAPSVLTEGEDKGADEKGAERGYGPVEETEDWDCPPSCPVRQLDEDSGDLGLASSRTKGEPREGATNFQPGPSNKVYDDPGGASRFYYCAKASRSEREAGLPDVEGRANRHPTVKPIDLCRWLVRLVTRPEHTALDPFMGSGSIGCAAVQERRNYIGLDLEPEYVEIARQRIEHWTPKQRDMFKD